MSKTDPNISTSNLHQHINVLLDEFAPYKKLSKKEYKLKTKPWINTEILSKIKTQDKLLPKYCKAYNKCTHVPKKYMKNIRLLGVN